MSGNRLPHDDTPRPGRPIVSESLSPDGRQYMHSVMSVAPCEARRAAFERGAIALVAGDQLQRVWAGRGNGVEFLMVGLDSAAGDLWAMGRFRVVDGVNGTTDGKTWGTNDPTMRIRISAARSIPAWRWEGALVTVLRMAILLGVEPASLVERDAERRQGEAAADFIASVVGDVGGIAGIASIDT